MDSAGTIVTQKVTRLFTLGINHVALELIRFNANQKNTTQMQQSVEVVVSISKNLDQVTWHPACDTRALDNNTINWFMGNGTNNNMYLCCEKAHYFPQ